MMRIFKILSHMLFMIGVLLFWILPSRKYDWMRDFDSSSLPSSVEDVSNNRVIPTFLLLVLIVSPQLVLIVKSHSLKEKALSIGLIAVAVGIWFFKFWG